MELRIYDDGHDNPMRFAVWIEPQDGIYAGTCIGCAGSEIAAINDAREGLQRALADLEAGRFERLDDNGKPREASK